MPADPPALQESLRLLKECSIDISIPVHLHPRSDDFGLMGRYLTANEPVVHQMRVLEGINTMSLRTKDLSGSVASLAQVLSQEKSGSKGWRSQLWDD